jgi:2-hydroxy-3-keto-5-methylthiopentenyl-1-phosphate phosphatase
MLILTDFDGTITTDDVTNVLWDRYGMPSWRETLLPDYRAGRKTTLELMDEGWRVIDRPEAELIGEARHRIGLRDGFERFVGACRERAWPLHVISCGLDWYLRAFLPAGVPYDCYLAERRNGWRVIMPPHISLPPGADFKVHVMRGLQAQYSGLQTVFIGDGRNDLPIARAADRVFAIRDSSLARLCQQDGLLADQFDSFDQIWSALERREPAAFLR